MTTTGVRFAPRSGESWRDPFPMYAALQDDDPVHHVDDGDYWVLSRFADVFAAARDTATFSSAEGLTFTYDERRKAGLEDVAPLVMLDPPDHTAFRRLVARGFTPRQVAAIEPEVRAFVVERVERLRAAGGGDVVAELFKPLPSFVVAHYLGVPGADRARFDGWTEAIVAANAAGRPARRRARGGRAVRATSPSSSSTGGGDPGDDAVSELVQAGDAAGVSTLRRPRLRLHHGHRRQRHHHRAAGRRRSSCWPPRPTSGRAWWRGPGRSPTPSRSCCG